MDPIAQRVTVLPLRERLHDSTVFEGEAAIATPFLAELASARSLTAAQVLTP